MTPEDTMVSVIIPYVNEWPQIVFTIRSVIEELDEYVDFEIIVIDNYCIDVHNQKRLPDRGHSRYVRNDKTNLGFYNVQYDPKKMEFVRSHLEVITNQQPRLKYIRYDDKLSHWNAKNIGVANSTGNILLFLDAHVIPSKCGLRGAIKCFMDMNLTDMKYDTLHLPLTYNILEDKRLLYKLIWKPSKGDVHYRFLNTFPELTELVEVPCMSTCGMFMRRHTFEKLGGWPKGLGIYGGGENFVNFVLATMGHRKFIYPYGTLHHHGDRRGYEFNWTDYHRNRMIATYCFGGYDWLDRYEVSLGGNNVTTQLAMDSIKCSQNHANRLSKHQFISIEDWFKEWEYADVKSRNGRRFADG